MRRPIRLVMQPYRIGREFLKSFALWTKCIAESEIGTLCTLCLRRSWIIGVDVVLVRWILDIVLFETLVATDFGRLQ